MKIYGISSITNNYKSNENKRNITTTINFTGSEQKAFISEIRAIVNRNEIPNWQRGIRDYIMKVDKYLAFIPDGFENTFVHYPKTRRFNLGIFDKITSVKVDELGTTIGTTEEDDISKY